MAAATYNVNRDPKKSKPIGAMDFFESEEHKAVQTQTAEQVGAIFFQLHAACELERGEM